MSKSPKSSIVKILYGETGGVAGAGVLIGKKWILTCRHVIEEISPSAKIGDKIYLTFYLDESEKSIESNIILLADGKEPDIAILELEEEIPIRASIGKLAIKENFNDLELRACDFSSGLGGEWISIVGRGRAYPNYLQIDVSKDTGYKIEGGV